MLEYVANKRTLPDFSKYYQRQTPQSFRIALIYAAKVFYRMLSDATCVLPGTSFSFCSNMFMLVT